MNVLLDTHAVLWLASTPTTIESSTLNLVSDPDTRVWVSAASAWEVAIKNRLGRLDAAALLSAWAETMDAMNVVELPIGSADAILAGQLAWAHKDPFDRVIVAQALRRGYTVATRDSAILGAGLASTIAA